MAGGVVGPTARQTACPSLPGMERFASLSTGEPNCALRADGSPLCWSEYLSRPSRDRRMKCSPPSAQPAGTLRPALRRHRRLLGLQPLRRVVTSNWNSRCGQRRGNAAHRLGRNQQRRHPDLRPGLRWPRDLLGAQLVARQVNRQFVAVTSGSVHACALRADGTVECHGATARASLRRPAHIHLDQRRKYAHLWSSPRRDSRVLGQRRQRGVNAPSGRIVPDNQWGAGPHLRAPARRDSGLLGRSVGPEELRYAASPHDGIFSEISSGYWHTCGLRTHGDVECWGLDRQGQSSAPPGRFIAVSSGGYHSCALRDDGTPVCWVRAARPTPWTTTTARDSRPKGGFVSISAGIEHTCGIRADGTPVCWGQDQFRQASPRE